jgi:hypothetical protein
MADHSCLMDALGLLVLSEMSEAAIPGRHGVPRGW